MKQTLSTLLPVLARWKGQLRERHPFGEDLGRFIPKTKRSRLAVGAGGLLILGGAILIFAPGPDRKPHRTVVVKSKPAKAPVPWHAKQAPPPAMVRLPDTKLPPLMPEKPPSEDTETKEKPKAPERPQAYEEALPTNILAPPAKPPPVPQIEVFDESQGPPPWRHFSVVAEKTSSGPLIAIVIDDVGVDKKRSARAMNLPAPLTIAMLSYAPDIARQAETAKAAGHELLVHVSMEPTSLTVDPGPHVLLSGQTEAEIMKRLTWDLERFSGYVGINNHMGSHFTADAKGMGVVMAELKRRGLLFLDSRTTGKSVGGKLARSLGVPHAERNIFLDNEPTEEAVLGRLAQVEKFAKRWGHAIAIGHPRDATLNALSRWITEARGRGFVFVPISTIVARRLGISLAKKSGDK